jgi:hypothetical protein
MDYQKDTQYALIAARGSCGAQVIEGGIKMKRIMLTITALMLLGGTAHAAGGTSNLCFNGSFDNTNHCLEGWTYNYEWLGNSHYMKNHERVSAVSSYQGRQKVAFINATGQTKFESKPIPYEYGKRYRCELKIRGGGVRMYFAGYKWDAGVRPHANPHLGKLRRIYKSKPCTGGSGCGEACGGGWTKATFEFPLENVSDLGKQHLKHLRYFTIYILGMSGGKTWVDDVRVTTIRETKTLGRKGRR